jgi:hypothetical protein
MSEKVMGMTVRELAYSAEEKVFKGCGDKKVYISSDDEGNDVHELFYPFCSDKEVLSAYGLTEKNILLGYIPDNGGVKHLTVRDLSEYAKKAVENGFGDREIYLTKDEEGNGVHFLYYDFTDKQSILSAYNLKTATAILLG